MMAVKGPVMLLVLEMTELFVVREIVYGGCIESFE
jgi:hypothetical protein